MVVLVGSGRCGAGPEPPYRLQAMLQAMRPAGLVHLLLAALAALAAGSALRAIDPSGERARCQSGAPPPPSPAKLQSSPSLAPCHHAISGSTLLLTATQRGKKLTTRRVQKLEPG